jgi:glycosyltransferase involved in cell wall biosynthesis
VFLCALDEIASDCWRRATWFRRPPAELRGRIGGIYHRPRFLAGDSSWLDANLKLPGFERLVRERWFNPLLFVDEFLAARLRSEHPGAPIHFLPDPCPTGYTGDRAVARQQLGLPADRPVFLFYGTGARRKGLHLAVEALLQLPAEHPAFLFCAGRQEPAGPVAAGLARLAQQNRALLLDRYVSEAEEKLCLIASDVVLLPYLNHFGTSGVLSRAMAAGRPVIASDEQLLGDLVRLHGLGLLFPSGNVAELAGAIRRAAAFTPPETAAYVAAASRYAGHYSRAAFRAALLRSLDLSAPTAIMQPS